MGLILKINAKNDVFNDVEMIKLAENPTIPYSGPNVNIPRE